MRTHPPLHLSNPRAPTQVLSDKPRMSISGWYHAPTLPKGADKASLAQLQMAAGEDAVTGHALFEGGLEAMPSGLSEEDRQLLGAWVAGAYLDPQAWPQIQKKFEADGSIQLQVGVVGLVARGGGGVAAYSCRWARVSVGVGVEWRLPAAGLRRCALWTHSLVTHSLTSHSLTHSLTHSQGFLRPEVAGPVLAATQQADAADSMGRGRMPPFTAGYGQGA